MKMETKQYIEPEIEITMFDVEDVITTSDGLGGGGIVLPDDEW
jgi:hypothetical protein